jgi:hypothetical protein
MCASAPTSVCNFYFIILANAQADLARLHIQPYRLQKGNQTLAIG